MSLARRFRSSAISAYSSQIGRAVMRAGSDLLLARLLAPSEHGAFEVAYGLVVIAGLVRDLGLPYQLVREEHPPYGAALAWTVGSGALLTALLASAGPILSALGLGGTFQGALAQHLPWFSLYVLLDGLAVVPRIWFERNLEVRRLVLPELLRGATVAGLACGMALSGLGVVSLFAGELAGAALYAAILWFRAYGKIPLVGGRIDLIRQFRASGLLFLIALAALPMPYVQRFGVGWGHGAAEVGFFGKARTWGFRLQELLQPAVARVLYPALVAYRGDRPRFFAAFRLGTISILALEVLFGWGFFVNAELLITTILLGPQWGPAVPIVKILCLSPLVDPLSRLGGEVLKVEREDRSWLAVVLLNLASLLALGLPLAWHFVGRGMAWAQLFLLGNLWMSWRIYRICRRHDPAEFRRLVSDLGFVYLLPLPLFALAALAFPAGSWSRLGASLLAAGIAGFLFLRRFRAPMRELFTERAEGAQ